MKIRNISLIAVVALAAGCVESHRARVVYYTPDVTTPPVVAPAPTSDRPDVRVYSTTPTAPPPNVLSGDVALADSVSNLLKGDSHMASASANVLVKVRNGIVDLRGTVPSEQNRDEIVARVSQLPGVREVKDELTIEH